MAAAEETGWEWRTGAHGVGWWEAVAFAAHGVRAIFSSRLGGVSGGPFAALNLSLGVGDAPEAVAANRARFAAALGLDLQRRADLEQEHGARVRPVRAAGHAGRGDALVSATADLPLVIGVADCLAIYLLDPARRTLGLCHSGWRGTVADVVGAAVRAMGEAFGSRPTDLWAALSPGIGPCCYTVGADVVRALTGSAPWAARVLGPAPGTGAARLDLWSANRLRLQDAGVQAQRIHCACICTACCPDLLYSYRRDGGRTGRMWAVLVAG